MLTNLGNSECAKVSEMKVSRSRQARLEMNTEHSRVKVDGGQVECWISVKRQTVHGVNI